MATDALALVQILMFKWLSGPWPPICLMAVSIVYWPFWNILEFQARFFIQEMKIKTRILFFTIKMLDTFFSYVPWKHFFTSLYLLSVLLFHFLTSDATHIDMPQIC